MTGYGAMTCGAQSDPVEALNSTRLVCIRLRDHVGPHADRLDFLDIEWSNESPATGILQILTADQAEQIREHGHLIFDPDAVVDPLTSIEIYRRHVEPDGAVRES